MYIRNAFAAGVLASNIAALVSPAGAQAYFQNEPSHPPITIYLQASDARFDAYLYVKKYISTDDKQDISDELFYIPLANSKGREKEFADWRRKFNLIVSAATLSESVQLRISRVKDEFSRADSASECWTEDYKKERRITITIIGSASETVMENEYKVASKLFLADPGNFRCTYKTAKP